MNRAHASIPTTERNYLIALYNQTNGPSWLLKTNWLGAAGTECTWYGVTCDALGDHVTRINLANNALSGTLPSNLNALSFLVYFEAFGNAVGGTIPAISAMTKLERFRMNTNLLTGTIPALPASINIFLVNNNQLTGSLPSLAGLTALTAFQAANNQLTGSIPSLAGLSSLVSFSVYSNQLSGTLPAISGLSNLILFYVDNNQISGTIPIFLLLPALTTYDVSNNNLTGGIPSLAAAPNLQFFFARGNSLSGFLPDLTVVPQLKFLGLSHNNFTGTIPPIQHLTALERFDVDDNELIGNLPHWAGLANLISFGAAFNRLTGEIPPLTGLTSLQSLSLNENQLTGSIPALAGSPLKKLIVNANQLTGGLPTAPAQLTPELSWLCPNQLTPSADAAWDAATFGAGAWSTNCIAPRLPQTLKYTSLSSLNAGSSYGHSATSLPNPGSSQPIVYLSLTPQSCTVTSVAGVANIFVSASARIGSRCRIAANKAGDATFNAAAHVEMNSVITRNVNPNACKLDADGNGFLLATTDGVLLMRYLMGFRGAALTENLVLGGLRTTPAAIANYLDGFNFNVTNAAGAPATTRTMTNAMVIMRYFQALPPILMVTNTGVSAGDAFSALNNIDAWCPDF